MNYIGTLCENEFIKFLMEKQMFRKRNIKINESIEVPYIEINTDMKLRRDKNVDIYKMKFKDSHKIEVKSEKDSSENKPKEQDLAFFRSDYVQSAIMKECKRQKEDVIEASKLYKIITERTKIRFELEKALFSKSIEKLLKNEYIEKQIIKYETSSTPEVIGYKYLP